MNRVGRKIFSFLAIVGITGVLLEVFSAGVLKFYKPKPSPLQKDFIYKKNNKDGLVIPQKDFVLPISESRTVNWKTNEYSVTISTNSHGLREDFEISNENVRVAFFGDSFTFGQGVEAAERYTNVFARNYGKGYEKKVANFSYKNGFQPEHYEYFIRNNEDIKPAHVVIGLYLGNDLGADLRETMYDPGTNQLALPYRRILDSGQMANAPAAYRWPIRSLVGFSRFAKLLVNVVGKTRYREYILEDRFGGPNAPNDIALETGAVDLSKNRAVESLRRINEIVTKRGGSLTIVIIPQNYFFSEANPHIHPKLKRKIREIRSGRNILVAFKEICQMYQLSCLDTSEFLRQSDYYEQDGHWNRSGNYKVGVALADYLGKKK